MESRQTSPSGVYKRTVGNLADFVGSFEKMDLAAAACDASRPTLYKRLESNGWKLQEFIAACIHQRDSEGHTALLDELIADVKGIRPTEPSQFQICKDLKKLAAEDGKEVAHILDAIDDNRIDEQERQNLLEKVRKHAAALNAVANNLEGLRT